MQWCSTGMCLSRVMLLVRYYPAGRQRRRCPRAGHMGMNENQRTAEHRRSRKSPYLVGRPVAVLDAAQQAELLVPLALHVHDRVHDVLQHARACLGTHEPDQASPSMGSFARPPCTQRRPRCAPACAGLVRHSTCCFAFRMWAAPQPTEPRQVHRVQPLDQQSNRSCFGRICFKVD
jgi:hypothetical protein